MRAGFNARWTKRVKTGPDIADEWWRELQLIRESKNL